MSKKNRKKNRKADVGVGDFLLASQRENNRSDQKATNSLGRGIAFLVASLLTPLLPAVTKAIETQANNDRLRAEASADEMRARARQVRAAERRACKADKLSRRRAKRAA